MESRDTQNWAQSVHTLDVSQLPKGAHNISVQGKRIMGPVHGFGQLWQKTYRMQLKGARPDPVDVITEWKADFPKFWPKGNTLSKASGAIKPGDVGVVNLSAIGNVPMLATGIYVIYADDLSFSFMTPEGHPMAGMITFSVDADDDCTSAQVQVLLRANDPLYEIGMRTFMAKIEDQFWFQTLRNVAAHFGASGVPTLSAAIVDRRVQWREWKNVWQNAAVRTAIYIMGAPFRWVHGRLKGDTASLG